MCSQMRGRKEPCAVNVLTSLLVCLILTKSYQSDGPWTPSVNVHIALISELPSLNTHDLTCVASVIT